MSTRLNLSVDDDIPALLSALAGGERKRGDYLGDLVRSIYQSRAGEAMGIERLQVQIDGLIAAQRQAEGRLLAIERTVAALVADRAGR